LDKAEEKKQPNKSMPRRRIIDAFAPDRAMSAQAASPFSLRLT